MLGIFGGFLNCCVGYLSNFLKERGKFWLGITLTPEFSLVKFLLVLEYLSLQCLLCGGSDCNTVNSNQLILKC